MQHFDPQADSSESTRIDIDQKMRLGPLNGKKIIYHPEDILIRYRGRTVNLRDLLDSLDASNLLP